MVFVFDDFVLYCGVYMYNNLLFKVLKFIVKFNGLVIFDVLVMVCEYLISKIDEFSVNGLIFIVDILLEVVNYYGGRDVDYGWKCGESDVSSFVWRSICVSYRSFYIGVDLILFLGCLEDNLLDSDCIIE